MAEQVVEEKMEVAVMDQVEVEMMADRAEVEVERVVDRAEVGVAENKADYSRKRFLSIIRTDYTRISIYKTRITYLL
jgi:hypothetical protein